MKIAIDSGHGLNTPGKRTPLFPDGSHIREWQFNHPTALKLGELLVGNGFEIVFVSPGEEDTPLATRTTRANQAKADLFVSIHYNAATGIWGSANGTETYHHPSSSRGQKLAELIQKELIAETGRRDRGVKSANFQVLRETTMPAVLVECGFMDSLVEACLMLDEEYQTKCARAMAKGICAYFGKVYVEPVEVPVWQRIIQERMSSSEQWIELIEGLIEKGEKERTVARFFPYFIEKLAK